MQGTLLMLDFLFSSAIVLNSTDGPPVIVQPAGLTDPQNLVVLGNRSSSNTLTCGAENADNVQWMYRYSTDSEFAALPKPFVQQPLVVNDAGILIRTLKEDVADPTLRHQLNGIYQCYAANDKGYISMTPPILFILPFVATVGYRLRHVMASAYSPFQLTCIVNQAFIVPLEAVDRTLPHFSWQIANNSEILTYIREDARIRIDPTSGDLCFAYLELNDSSELEGGLAEYQCMVRFDDSPKAFLLSRTNLTVVDASDPEAVEYQLMVPSEHEANITCKEKALCILTCIYRGRVNGQAPSNTSWLKPTGAENISLYVDRSSIKFVAEIDAEGNWTCNLNQYSKPGLINVKILALPYLNESELMSQYVEEGQDVTFSCNALHSSLVEFFFGGESITSGRQPFIQHTPGSNNFTIPNVHRDHSSSVACMARNAAGTKFLTAELLVYYSPIIVLHAHVTRDDIGLLEFKVQCTVSLDSKVSRASLYWQTSLSVFNGNRITRPDGLWIAKVSTTPLLDGTLKSILHVVVQRDILKSLWWCDVQFGFNSMGAVENISRSSNSVYLDACPAEEVCEGPYKICLNSSGLVDCNCPFETEGDGVFGAEQPTTATTTAAAVLSTTEKIPITRTIIKSTSTTRRKTYPMPEIMAVTRSQQRSSDHVFILVTVGISLMCVFIGFIVFMVPKMRSIWKKLTVKNSVRPSESTDTIHQLDDIDNDLPPGRWLLKSPPKSDERQAVLKELPPIAIQSMAGKPKTNRLLEVDDAGKPKKDGHLELVAPGKPKIVGHVEVTSESKTKIANTLQLIDAGKNEIDKHFGFSAAGARNSRTDRQTDVSGFGGLEKTKMSSKRGNGRNNKVKQKNEF